MVIVDDHMTFTELLAIGLSHAEGLVCVGTAGSVAAGMALVDDVRPDVVVMDVELGDGDGIDATATLVARHPELRVVVLTARTDSALMRRAANAGACCLLPKNGSLVEILQFLRTARPGGLAVHPALLKMLVTPSARQTIDVRLTARELEVLRGLGRGDDVRSISAELGISLHTCRGHVRRALAKLGARSQLEAVAIARRQGLVNDGH